MGGEKKRKFKGEVRELEYREKERGLDGEKGRDKRKGGLRLKRDRLGETERYGGRQERIGESGMVERDREALDSLYCRVVWLLMIDALRGISPAALLRPQVMKVK